MCGIFGIGSIRGVTRINEDKLIKLLHVMGEKTETRGRYASGIAIANYKTINLIKSPDTMTSFLKKKKVVATLQNEIKLSDADEEKNTYAIIAHCRFPTKGSEKNNLNNHPIMTDDIVGVHTGHITNDDSLFKCWPEIKRRGEVDSEIIFQIINKERKLKTMTDAIISASTYLVGGYASALLCRADKYKLYLFRNHNPIDINLYYNLGIVVFSSSYDSITRKSMQEVFEKEELENKSMHLGVNSGMVIDLKEKKYHIFKLKNYGI